MKPWIERLARIGYAAKGIVYATIGALTAAAGLHRGGGAADRHNAIQYIAQQPFGRLLLFVMAAGLVGYAVWRVLSGLTGSESKNLAVRAGSIVRGLFYASLAYTVMRLLLHKGGAGQSSDTTSKHWTARALDQPFGRWLLVAAGLGLLGYGVYQCYRAASGKLRKHLDLSSVNAQTRKTLLALSAFGVVARAIVFGVIGVSLLRAALHGRASAARGTSGALRQLAALPLGSWILTVMGLGLVAYGLYAFINARYRRISVR